jgi:hypothetical protein
VRFIVVNAQEDDRRRRYAPHGPCDLETIAIGQIKVD